MIYDALARLVGSMECFDLPMLAQGFAEPRASIRVQLSRWMKDGKVLGLRRGIYTLSDTYRRTAIAPARLANQLYRPSYLSGLWALSYYDMIPEAVVWLTSVTTRVPRQFKNSFGVFDYHNIKKSAFWGYTTVPFAGGQIFLAEPEKALLDHWHLNSGEWTHDRLEEMRYQNYEPVNNEKLQAYAERFQSPRLCRAVERWLALTSEEEKGAVIL